jgi:hypothetical protein
LAEEFDMAEDDLKQSIEENAKGPAKASGDAGSVEQHKLTDQIAADKHLAGKDAVAKPHRGLRFNKLVPPSAG